MTGAIIPQLEVRQYVNEGGNHITFNIYPGKDNVWILLKISVSFDFIANLGV